MSVLFVSVKFINHLFQLLLIVILSSQEEVYRVWYAVYADDKFVPARSQQALSEDALDLLVSNIMNPVNEAYRLSSTKLSSVALCVPVRLTTPIVFAEPIQSWIFEHFVESIQEQLQESLPAKLPG